MNTWLPRTIAMEGRIDSSAPGETRVSSVSLYRSKRRNGIAGGAREEARADLIETPSIHSCVWLMFAPLPCAPRPSGPNGSSTTRFLPRVAAADSAWRGFCHSFDHEVLNGHSDVVGGAVVAADKADLDELAVWANIVGVAGAPFDAFLTLRAYAHCFLASSAQATAAVVATFLTGLAR